MIAIDLRKYQGAFRIAQHDLGMTQNYIVQMGRDALFQLMEEKGRKWVEERQIWIELASGFPARKAGPWHTSAVMRPNLKRRRNWRREKELWRDMARKLGAALLDIQEKKKELKVEETDVFNKLQRYCDLTPGQLYDLFAASTGKLKTMNGARREAMDKMIDERLAITPFGREVLERARRIETGTFIEPQWVPRKLYPWSSAARTIVKFTSLKTITTCHLKALHGLYFCPGEAYGWLVHVYGARPLYELIEWQLAIGGTFKGAAWNPTFAGRELVETFLFR